MTTPGSASGAQIGLHGLVKAFGAFRAVDDVSLDVPAGTFVTLLGPSGSGKTTTLNLIAGFVEPDAGEILADGVAISGVPPHLRNIGMVFQSYALFPHMTVLDNVTFPLRMRSGLSRAARRTRALETLDLVRLAGLEGRYPRQLSGGQQQRVSMARALVSQPRLLLMDEPLGALDKKLRENMQLEIKQIHRQVGANFVYVTHDQGEAPTMSDLVVVMNDGRIVQSAPPREIYTRPATRFVADFPGQANLLPARVVARDATLARVRLVDGTEVAVPVAWARRRWRWATAATCCCAPRRSPWPRVRCTRPPRNGSTGRWRRRSISTTPSGWWSMCAASACRPPARPRNGATGPWGLRCR